MIPYIRLYFQRVRWHWGGALQLQPLHQQDQDIQDTQLLEHVSPPSRHNEEFSRRCSAVVMEFTKYASTTPKVPVTSAVKFSVCVFVDVLMWKPWDSEHRMLKGPRIEMRLQARISYILSVDTVDGRHHACMKPCKLMRYWPSSTGARRISEPSTGITLYTVKPATQNVKIKRKFQMLWSPTSNTFALN